MKILKTLDASKTAKARKIIFFATLFIFISIWLSCSESLRIFAIKHPGLIGVLIAVAGEVYFDWKEETGKNSRLKKFFMALLVFSLTYELYEASNSDKEAAIAIKLAAEANERARAAEKRAADSNERTEKADKEVAVLSNETVRLSINLEESRTKNLELEKQVFGIATQIGVISTNIEQVRVIVNSPEIIARLKETKKSLTDANKTMADVKEILASSNLTALADLKPKSLKERIIDCLNSIDKKIVPGLALSSTSIPVKCDMESATFSDLKKLAAEPGAWQYIQITGEPYDLGLPVGGTTWVVYGVKMWLYPTLLKKE